MDKKINYSDISVVVQGPIVGSKKNKPENRHTQICLKSIRKYLPGSTIILSTWKGSDIEGLDYDILIENKDPGPNIMFNETGNYQANCFRQIVSSINGLMACDTKYALKIRTDLKLKNSNFINYFLKYNKVQFDDEYKILKQRVITLSTCNPNRRTKWPFNVCDWLFFGLTDDIKNIFDIPATNNDFLLKKDDDPKYKIINYYSPEQYIWFRFLSKYRKITFNYREDISNNNIEISERYFANNCIFLSAKRAGITWLKLPGGAYSQIPCLSNSGLYTFNEYKKLLNKYAKNNILIIPNIFENIIYYVIYNLRFKIKKIFPKLDKYIHQIIDTNTNNKISRNKI